MSWNGKRVLITGAGGFIGSHLTERLVTLGARPRAFVHYNALGSQGWLDRSPAAADVEIVAGDICDRDSVREAVRGTDIVFHLAALIAIPYSYRAPESYVRTNVDGTLNVLHAVRELGIERLVHTSTSETYGTARYVPIDEAHPLQAQSPYAATKIAADKLAESFRLSYSLPIVTVRPFNTFGPRQSPRAVVPAIISQCLDGETLRLGNLTPTRDLNFVSNTVDGFVAAASAPDAVGHTVNLGTGREISIGDLANLIASVVGRRAQVQTDDARIRPSGSEVERLLASNALAKSLLGWEPAVSLEDGIRLTVEWMQAHHQRGRGATYVI